MAFTLSTVSFCDLTCSFSSANCDTRSLSYAVNSLILSILEYISEKSAAPNIYSMYELSFIYDCMEYIRSFNSISFFSILASKLEIEVSK